MGYKNLKELLVGATALPARVEERLPEGAPKFSVRMAEAVNRMPDLPDFPIELPDLPPIPEMPRMPGAPVAARAGRVTEGREVPPLAPPAKRRLRYLY